MPLNRMVVATDFASAARAGLDRALQIPLASRGHISVMHVMPQVKPAALQKKVRAAAEAALLSELARVEPPDHLQLGGGLMAGDMVPELILHSAAVRADLVVVGLQGMGAVAPGLNTLRLLRECHQPVLVAKPGVGLYQRALVVVPVGSKLNRVLPLVQRVAPEAALTVVGVAPVPADGYGDMVAVAVARSKREVLKRFKAELKATGVRPKMEFCFGDARPMVTQAASSYELVCLDSFLAPQLVGQLPTDVLALR